MQAAVKGGAQDSAAASHAGTCSVKTVPSPDKLVSRRCGIKERHIFRTIRRGPYNFKSQPYGHPGLLSIAK
jgi:hypothetical protein